MIYEQFQPIKLCHLNQDEINVFSLTSFRIKNAYVPLLWLSVSDEDVTLIE